MDLISVHHTIILEGCISQYTRHCIEGMHLSTHKTIITHMPFLTLGPGSPDDPEVPGSPCNRTILTPSLPTISKKRYIFSRIPSRSLLSPFTKSSLQHTNNPSQYHSHPNHHVYYLLSFQTSLTWSSTISLHTQSQNLDVSVTQESPLNDHTTVKPSVLVVQAVLGYHVALLALRFPLVHAVHLSQDFPGQQTVTKFVYCLVGLVDSSLEIQIVHSGRFLL